MEGGEATYGEAPIRAPTTDPLNTEFVYYSAVLRMFGPTLTKEGDRRYIIPWIRKLFRPEYHSSQLREKRNKYLAYLTTSLLLDEAVDTFRRFPPDGPLPDLQSVRPGPVAAAQWETDNMWQDSLQNLPDDFSLLDCYIHDEPEMCKKDHQFDKILDQEFQLYLYLIKPYAAMISSGTERTRVAAWLQMLCSVHGNECCSRMKAIRNDYMMALLGYVHDLRAVGPFAENPSWQTLKPLAEAAKLAVENCAITDPTGCYANEFLANQPMPDDGAFCYIAITGDLVTSNLPQT
ncbi:unnamed protein product [Ceutorhynchus assimilis]|uniref:DUF4485 domain-containing protein n=1 Tax=Ceutorhynchus assimilis TaxID=467358 RepID=A0A9N9QE57_9CUCU|nr:unnamed protein product [Ceutorhynchus assimilis]